MDVQPPAVADNPPAASPQPSAAPPSLAAATPAPSAPAPQFNPQKWEHMLSIATPDERDRMLKDLGGVPNAQYLADNKAVLCASLGIPDDKQFLVSGNSVAELTKSANTVAEMLKPAGYPPAVDNSAPSAPPAPANPPADVQPPTVQPRNHDLATSEGFRAAYVETMS